jgi:hypothetical protein
MKEQSKLQEAIEALDRVHELLQGLDPKLLERGVWAVVTGLSALQQYLRSIDAEASVEARATALFEVSEKMGKKSEPLLHHVIHDPSTPPKVSRAAQKAQSRVQRRARQELLNELATPSARRALMDELLEVIGPRLNELLTRISTASNAPTSEPPANLHDSVSQVVANKLTDYYRRRVEGPLMINYHGLFCARVESRSGASGLESDGSSRVRAGQVCLLTAWLQPGGSPPENAASGEVEISNGEKADLVPFNVRVETDDLKFNTTSQAITAPIGNTSSRVQFACMPQQIGKKAIWVQLLQQNRLIQVVEIQVEVAGEEKGT